MGKWGVPGSGDGLCTGLEAGMCCLWGTERGQAGQSTGRWSVVRRLESQGPSSQGRAGCGFSSAALWRTGCRQRRHTAGKPVRRLLQYPVESVGGSGPGWWGGVEVEKSQMWGLLQVRSTEFAGKLRWGGGERGFKGDSRQWGRLQEEQVEDEEKTGRLYFDMVLLRWFLVPWVEMAMSSQQLSSEETGIKTETQVISM